MKLNLLIIDDDAKILRNLRLLFRDDYTVFAASDTAEGRRILDRDDIHIVICDYRMPGEDGLSFLIHLRERFPWIVRVLITAYGDVDLVIRALNEGEVHRFVAKPYRSDELVTIIAECAGLVEVEDRPGDPSRREKTVLAAHDSQVTLSVLQIMLGGRYRVVKTSDGLELITLLSDEKVDALVIGIGLEMIDGGTIITFLKKEKKSPIPVVAWGRDISPQLVQYFRTCGADIVIDEKDPDKTRLLLAFLEKSFR